MASRRIRIEQLILIKLHKELVGDEKARNLSPLYPQIYTNPDPNNHQDTPQDTEQR